MILELGKANLFPFAPDAKIKAAPLAAIPMHMVETSDLIYWMVSYMAMVEVTEPPGLLI